MTGLPVDGPRDSFPVALVRGVGRAGGNVLADAGRFAHFLGEMVRALREVRTWSPELVRQMRGIGVDSLPLVVTVAAFLGAVSAFQTRYQLFPGVQLSVVGLITRQSIVLELGPLLTALTLTGRVGAKMTAEIGTMRVTEQIDALETLAFDPVAYLAVPRVIAALIMIPALVLVANFMAIASAFVTLILATDVTPVDFEAGLRLAFIPFQVWYSVIKSVGFGGLIALCCSYQGYVAEAGAEGVGRSTAKAVVVASVAILVWDGVVAALLAPFIQA
ncbi:MAG: ABC transporter permease [Gemmatimonadaceae bacterium]|nr:ABC transporter permease [Gemmatimonadaceae bacterium]